MCVLMFPFPRRLDTCRGAQSQRQQQPQCYYALAGPVCVCLGWGWFVCVCNACWLGAAGSASWAVTLCGAGALRLAPSNCRMAVGRRGRAWCVLFLARPQQHVCRCQVAALYNKLASLEGLQPGARMCICGSVSGIIPCGVATPVFSVIDMQGSRTWGLWCESVVWDCAACVCVCLSERAYLLNPFVCPTAAMLRGKGPAPHPGPCACITACISLSMAQPL